MFAASVWQQLDVSGSRQPETKRSIQAELRAHRSAAKSSYGKDQFAHAETSLAKAHAFSIVAAARSDL